jgi:hypothetical protein
LHFAQHLIRLVYHVCLQDLALWSAYAIVEGAAGHLEVARKVFDTTIGSLPALSKVNFSLSLSLSLSLSFPPDKAACL